MPQLGLTSTVSQYQYQSEIFYPIKNHALVVMQDMIRLPEQRQSVSKSTCRNLDKTSEQNLIFERLLLQ